MILPLGQLVRLNPKKISAGVIILLLQLFLFVQREAIYGPFAAQVERIFVAYFFLLALSLATLGAKIPTGAEKPEKLVNFAVGFLLTAMVMLPLAAFVHSQASIEQELSFAFSFIGFASIHSLVKAYTEEVVFRYLIPIVGGFGDVISAVIFGLFHFAVSGASIPVMVFLMGMGLVWALVRNRFGLMGAIGSHTAYNFAALGVLSQIFGFI